MGWGTFARQMLLVDAVGTNFIGSKRLAKNLEIIPQGIVQPLQPHHREQILRGLEAVLPTYHLDKIWEIIRERWRRYAHV